MTPIDLQNELNQALDWKRTRVGNEDALANEIGVSDTTLWRIRQLMISRTCKGILQTVVEYYNRPSDQPPTN